MKGNGIASVSGGSIPGGEGPAYTCFFPAGAPLPMLIAAPHGGRDYPPGLTERMRDPQFSMPRLEDRLVDRLADAIARQTGAGLLVAHAPRAMVDLNRAPDDIDWSMVAEGADPGARHSLANRRARSGLGLVPRRLPGHGEIWRDRLSRTELEARIATIHQPYHAALASMLEDLRDRWGAALLIDLHSMPPLRATQAGEPAREFVIGDRFGASCDRFLVTAALEYLESRGRPAAHNRPYAGGFVLDRHGAPRRGIHALQLEICRASYLDANLAEPGERMDAVIGLVAGLAIDLAAHVAALGSAARPPLAAE